MSSIKSVPARSATVTVLDVSVPVRASVEVETTMIMNKNCIYGRVCVSHKYGWLSQVGTLNGPFELDLLYRPIGLDMLLRFEMRMAVL